MSTPGTCDFDVDDASVFAISVTARDDDGSLIDLTGYAGALRVFDPGDDSELLIDYSIFEDDPGDDTGVFAVVLFPSELQTLTGQRYRYALQLFPSAVSNNCVTILRGWFNMQHSPAPVVPS